MEIDWNEESKRFDEAADYYDVYRPSYPQAVIDWLIENAGIRPQDKLLEIGAGSGKATELFVERGYELVCIEPGENLAKTGLRKFSGSHRVSYVVTRFEEWDEAENSFDFAFSAQAFHWVPKPIGFEKCARALKSRKYLALFWNWYPLGKDPVFNELTPVLRDYQLAIPSSDDEIEARVVSETDQINQSRRFKNPAVFRFPWEKRYEAEEYIGLLRTGNDYLRLQPSDREGLENGVRLTLHKNGGFIIRPYLGIAFLAQKLD
ncbi:MAG TPA: class I SAM-dependent methyltransferase [Bacillota bacterium]